MGKEFYCDLCRKGVPVADSLTPLSFGTDKVGELCLDCSSRIKTSLRKQFAEVAAKFSASLAPPQQIQQPAQPSEQTAASNTAQADTAVKTFGGA